MHGTNAHYGQRKPARRAQVDVESLSDAEKREWASLPHQLHAERLGVASAFRDLDLHGFAYAHAQAEQIIGGRDLSDLFYNKTWAYQAAYKQAVLGYWMALGL